jgi:hypothetical protein
LLKPKSPPLIRPRHRKSHQSRERDAARQPAFDCGSDKIRRKEGERNGHYDRSLRLPLSSGELCDALLGIADQFVEPAMGLTKRSDQDAVSVGAHRSSRWIVAICAQEDLSSPIRGWRRSEPAVGRHRPRGR